MRKPRLEIRVLCVPPLYSYRVRVFTIRLSFLLATKPDIWEISKPLVM